VVDLYIVVQYVTVNPSANVENIWRLMLEFWNLSPPNVIVSIAGKFQKYDSHWKKVMPDTWLITSGSAPAPATADAASIAVTDMNSIAMNGVLYSTNNSVSSRNFPFSTFTEDSVCRGNSCPSLISYISLVCFEKPQSLRLVLMAILFIFPTLGQFRHRSWLDAAG